jgi:hypothetical protein
MYTNVVNARSFRAADCGNDHHLVVAKIRERLAEKKQRSHIFLMERLNFKRLSEIDDNSIMLKSHIGLQLWKIWMLRWLLIMPGKHL